MAENGTISKAAEKDIKELQNKIGAYLTGQIDDEKFRAFRLVRGVYGQRQQGVQMIRIKLPFGKISPEQIIRIADISDKYASSNLHATTRQDIQIHYVKLANTPKVWQELEEKGVTLREACGNTVRNITASATAGIDPKEPFDVSPYAYSMFNYFLRNPICQEMGRKFKIAFSSSEEDTAYTFIHDLGFIPKIKDGKKGFKVMLAGGLGAQPFHAHVAHEFLFEDELMPYTESVIRVFDRYGERTRRNKARLKYLVGDIGIEAFVKLVAEEQKALKNKSYKVNIDDLTKSSIPATLSLPETKAHDAAKYAAWLKTNTFEQKQKGYFGVYVKVTIGDIKSDLARKFANVVSKYCSDDVRVTVNQGYLLKYVPQAHLVHLFNELNDLKLAEPGFDSTADVVACPGTDTCNLGIASSMGLAEELEKVMLEEYPDIIYNNDIKIKISGCMNACGQHTVAQIGFHGMSMKHGEMVLPGMQVLLGGGIKSDGQGLISEKVIKLPAKRTPQALRVLLDDFEKNGNEGEYFNDYFIRQGKNYFYTMLKPLAAITELTQDLMIDWGNTENYETAVGVGECAGVIVDMVQILLGEQQERLDKAAYALEEKNYADAIYHCYNTFVNGAKAMLLSKEVQCNTQHGIMNDFDTHFVGSGLVNFKEGGFKATVLMIQKNEPTEAFAKAYKAQAEEFLSNITKMRNVQLQNV